MSTNKHGRMADLETEARALARSGAFHDFRPIEARLRLSGYPETKKLFANRWTQEELNRICQQAQNSEPNTCEWDTAFLKLAHQTSN